MKLTADKLKQQLSKGLSPIYFVTGDEPLLVGEVTDAIRTAARKQGYEERESHSADARFDWAALLGGLDNLSLFASRKIVEMVKAAGAAEVHLRISSPPTKHSCFYGVDTPDGDELMANKMDLEAMRQAIGADSLAFVSYYGMYRAVGKPRELHCDACFSGDYPVPIEGPCSPQLSLLRIHNRKE